MIKLKWNTIIDRKQMLWEIVLKSRSFIILNELLRNSNVEATFIYLG